jgi:hypothetical protein
LRPSVAADTTTTPSMRCDEVASVSVESNIDNANAIMMKFFVVEIVRTFAQRVGWL